MNIIFVSNSMAKAKSLSSPQVAMIALALVLVPVLITLLILVPQLPDDQSGVKKFIPSQLQFSFNNPQKHLDAYAVQIGELQARIMRLDAQSERLAKLAGSKAMVKSVAKTKPVDSSPAENPTDENGFVSPLLQSPNAANLSDVEADKPNRGGPLVRSSPVSEADIQVKIAELIEQIELRTERLSSVEASLLQQTVLKDMLPNRSPVQVAFNSSSFGWRLDPFNGHKAFHEGLDFTANAGTAIYAAAGGIVSFADQTPDYGNIVKIEHGAGLETRYAHASRLFVRNGQRVEKGEKIAEVGSTGRSTGPHLHYEIRLNGNALDPRKYLSARN